MPIDNSPPRRDGHDHLKYSDDEDIRRTGAPRRVTRTNPSRQRNTRDEMLDEEDNMDDMRTGNDTSDIILLEPKSRTTQSRRHHHQQPQHRTTSPRRSEDYSEDDEYYEHDEQEDYEAPTTRRPTRTSGQYTLRQPSQSREPARHSAQQVPAIRQTTQPRRPDPRTDTYRDRDTRHAQKREIHWMVPFGITLIVAIMCYLLAYGVWTSSKNVYNDFTYGATTRTTNFDAVVGDHDSAASPTHFVALNLHGTINIMEFPGGDVTHAKVYPGPHLLWPDADKAVVTMEIKDVNGDKKPDLVIHVYGDTDLLFHQTTASFVLLNNGSGFSPMQAYQ